VENRLKELHHGLEMDRTSCSRFLANQFRVLLSLAAYMLFQELQRRAHGTACAGAQVTTLRERLIRLAVWVERSVRRIVLHLPATCPCNFSIRLKLLALIARVTDALSRQARTRNHIVSRFVQRKIAQAMDEDQIVSEIR
jgi:hypothetical protein